jgi:acetolactate synthase-1/2/3 large subunit
MKLTDAFANVIKGLGIKHVFGLQGGAVVHFFDSLERLNIGVTYNHHEESAALGATAFAKSSQNIGCAIVTTGPGSTNAITGLMSAWQDSVPCIFISGQARSSHVSYGKKVRQVGTQEVNICDIVKPLTKYTKFINKKENFLPELFKATKICLSDRPGPVWLDVALEVQWSNINFSKKYIYKKKDLKFGNSPNSKNYKKIFKHLSLSKRPILIVGSGVKGKIGENLFKKFINKYQIPFVTTWRSADIFETKNENNLGIIGMSGQRGANKAVFSSDLILCLGTHLSIPHTTTLFKDYVKNAYKIIINIDKHELQNTNVDFDLKIKDDINNFLKWSINNTFQTKTNWFDKKTFKSMNWYEPKMTKKPNSNIIVRKLTEVMKKKTCIIADGGGTALYSAFQSSIINKGNKLICSSSISSMGTGLAETIGVAKSKKFEKYICVIGDGSFLMNIQDLQTIVQDKINVIILVVNNNGYLAIRHTQEEFLKAKYYGTHPKFNLTLPSYKKISKAFGIKYLKIDKKNQILKTIDKLKKNNGPIVCEIITDENQPALFKQGYKKNTKGLFEPQPLSEMFPYFPKSIANTNN